MRRLARRAERLRRSRAGPRSSSGANRSAAKAPSFTSTRATRSASTIAPDARGC